MTARNLTPDEPGDPSHRLGKYTGYTLRDGQYHPAPVYREEFDAIAAADRATQMLIQAVAEYATANFAAQRHRLMALWDRLSDDFGVNFRAGASYDHRALTITMTAPAEEKPDATREPQS